MAEDEDGDEYDLTDEVLVTSLPFRSKGAAAARPSVPPPPPGSRASQASVASSAPPSAPVSAVDVLGPPPPLPTGAPPSVVPPPLPPRKPGLAPKRGSVLVSPTPVVAAVEAAPEAGLRRSPSSSHLPQQEAVAPAAAAAAAADGGDEAHAGSKGRSSHTRKDKKNSRMSSLLERLTPRRSGGGGEEELVVSAPSDFAHRAHGEPGLAQLLDPKEAAEEAVCNVRAVALWPFVAAMSGEISLVAGETVMLRERQDDADWWLGTNSRGELGWFPANLVTRM